VPYCLYVDQTALYYVHNCRNDHFHFETSPRRLSLSISISVSISVSVTVQIIVAHIKILQASAIQRRAMTEVQLTHFRLCVGRILNCPSVCVP